MDTQLLCTGFLHAGVAVSVSRALLVLQQHMFSAALYHQGLPDAFPISFSSAQGLEAKNGHLRNYREKGPVVKNQQDTAQTSLAVAGHRQPLYGILLGNRGHKIRSYFQVEH